MSTTLLAQTVFYSALLGALAAARPAPAETLRIGTLDASRNGAAALATSPLTGDLRDSLGAHIGELGFDGYEFVSTPVLTKEQLSGATIAILYNPYDINIPMDPPLSWEEQNALLDFVLTGGRALIVADGATADWLPSAAALVAPFGLAIAGSFKGVDLGTIEDPLAHPVTDGPFGEVTYLKTSDSGWFSDLGPYATALATLWANGQPSLAVIEEDALAAGSGRVVLMSDANPFGDADIFPDSLFFPEHEALFLNIVAWLTEGRGAPPPRFLRGDANDDAATDISDAVVILFHRFMANPISCEKAADANDDSAVDISDVVFLLSYLFLGGEDPKDPLGSCGFDLTPDALTCESFRGCQ